MKNVDFNTTAAVERDPPLQNHAPSSRRTFVIAVVGCAGAVAMFVSSLLAETVTLAPFFLLGAPVVFVSLVLGINSHAAFTVLGFLLYAGYAAFVTGRGSRKWAPWLLVVAIHLGSLFAIGLAPLLFGEGL